MERDAVSVYVGVDEAGKGPVLGPMVTAAVRADPASLPDDVDDSKRVAPARREAIADRLREHEEVAVAVAVIEPAEIDAPDTDMNTLTVCGQARAVRQVVRTGDRVLADAGDTSEDRFARRLAGFITDTGDADGADGDPNGTDRVPNGIDAEADGPTRDGGDGSHAPLAPLDVEARHGADESDPVVAAASIVAKVERDARMAAIDVEYPAYDGVGSGYPSDPTTRSFLRAYVDDHGDVPDCARRSWSTCADVLAAAEQSGLDDF